MLLPFFPTISVFNAEKDVAAGQQNVSRPGNMSHDNFKPAIDTNKTFTIIKSESIGSGKINGENIPDPKIELLDTQEYNEVVKEIIDRSEPPKKRRQSLPTEKFKYDSLYKTVFTISYHCSATLDSVIYWFKRNDIVVYDVTHVGMMESITGKHNESQQPVFRINRPENGEYTFMLYTVTKFDNIVREVQVIK
jgi:hypothetical protein